MLDGVSSLRLAGDGLRASQWDDLPPRKLEWQAPQGGTLQLAFPDKVALGRMFQLSAARDDESPMRLELVAENGQVLAKAAGTKRVTLEWLPPLAERVVLKARVLGEQGQLLAEGPVPFAVQAPVALQVVGRFGAPSFDLRVLNDLLTDSGALLDWQIDLGRALTRSETPHDPMAAPNLLVADAARVERMGQAERAALLARVADGMALLVLGGNASDSALWSRLIGLTLRQQPDGSKIDQPFELPRAQWAPGAAQSGPWTSTGQFIYARDWQKGRIGWLAVSDWHRYAISEPYQLKLWWQQVLDHVRVAHQVDTEWLAQDEMPLPGQRLSVCARGVSGKVALPDLKQTLVWQPRADRIDASCVALWPEQSGWLRFVDDKAGEHAVYVYAPGDWPQWQAAQRRTATARYAARSPVTVPVEHLPALPGWPMALVFALAMLLLWWREQR